MKESSEIRLASPPLQMATITISAEDSRIKFVAQPAQTAQAQLSLADK